MAEARDWQYYQLDPLTGVDPIIYFRYYYGTTDRLDTAQRTWISVNPDYLTRYIQFGEVGVDETTRSDVEDAVGFTLPD